MGYFNQYVVTKRFKGRAICGDLNLPFGTECFAKNEILYCDKGAICSVKSQNSYVYFTWNGDGCGEKRRKLIDSVVRNLDRGKQSKESYDEKWEMVWKDDTCLKYKRTDCNDRWLWSYAFYHAEISDLLYIERLITKR